METAIWIFAAYLIGGIPFGYLIGRMRGVDVRTVGSKNIGATNVFRTVGKKWGLLAFLCDVLKGLLPTLAARHFVPDAALWVGVGHNWPVFFRFKGGKGVATAFGMLLGLLPCMVGCAFALFALAFACTNYISLGSCTAALFMGVAVWFPVLGSRGVADLPQCILVSAIAAFVVFKHRSNIGRLLSGTESKVYLFGRGKKS